MTPETLIIIWSPALSVLVAGCAAGAALAALLVATLAAVARHPSASLGDLGEGVAHMPRVAVGQLRASGAAARRVLIVGAGARGRELAQAILRRPELGYYIVGFIDDEPGLPDWRGIRVLGGTADLGHLAAAAAADEIMVAHAPNWYDRMVEQLVACGCDEHVRVSSVLGMKEAVSSNLRLRTIADIPLVAVNAPPPVRAYRLVKRGLDVAFGLFALVLSAPAVAVLALLVKATSAGPAFFCQRRVGLHGRGFTIYKLRTMVHDAERATGPRLADPHDERVTRLGRFLRVTRLDELPQFYNVLRGDMSIIGPRPERPEFTGRYLREVPGYAKRLQVRPGITGLAQVYGAYNTNVYVKLRYDWTYVYHQSPWLDFKIMLQTARVVLSRGGC